MFINYKQNIPADATLINVGTNLQSLITCGQKTTSGAPDTTANKYISACFIQNIADGTLYVNMGSTASPSWSLVGGGGGGGITALTGDVTASGSGSVPATVVRLQGYPIDGVAPVAGQALVYDGAGYLPTYIPITSKVTLSSAQILNLGSVPVTLVASPGVGKFIQILSVTGRMNFGTVAYDTNTHLQVFTGALAGISFTDQDLLGSRFTINYAFNGPANVNTDEDVPVQIQVELGNPATGDGTLDIYTTYKIITL